MYVDACCVILLGLNKDASGVVAVMTALLEMLFLRWKGMRPLVRTWVEVCRLFVDCRRMGRGRGKVMLIGGHITYYMRRVSLE